MSALIALRNRDDEIVAHAIVDDSDFEWLSQWRWHMAQNGYARRSIDRGGIQRTIGLHRQILGLEPGDSREGDHRNGDRLDNRRENLRVVTRAQNQQNLRAKKAGATSRFRGVYFSRKAGKWCANVKVAGRSHHIGTFLTEEQAGAAAAGFRAEHMPFSPEAAA